MIISPVKPDRNIKRRIMKNSRAVYILILGILICSACTPVQKTTAPTPQVLVTSETVPTEPGWIKATPDVEEQWFKKLYLGTVTCNEYLPSLWRDKKDQTLSHFAIFVDKDSNLYLFDQVKKQILVYDGKTAVPIAVISIPEEFTANLHNAVFSVGTYQGNLYIPYDLGKIGVVDRSGKVVSRLTVPEKYNMHPITHLMIDEKGGLFLIDDHDLGYYFAPGWQDGKWNLVSMSSNGGNIDFRSIAEYGDYLIGINAQSEYPYPALTIYNLSDDGDFLESPLLFSVVYPDNLKNIREMALNEAGEFYTLHDFNEDWYVLTKQMIDSYAGEGGFIDKAEISNVSSMAVTHAGWVYLLSRGDDEKGIDPAVYRCHFDQ